MPLQCASGWECQEQCGLKDGFYWEKLIDRGEFDV